MFTAHVNGLQRNASQYYMWYGEVKVVIRECTEITEDLYDTLRGRIGRIDFMHQSRVLARNRPLL